MADLDDFFAKKGKKKKSKSGSKKTSDGTEDRAVVQLVTGTLEEVLDMYGYVLMHCQTQKQTINT